MSVVKSPIPHAGGAAMTWAFITDRHIVETMDLDELREGYNDGRLGEPEPGDNRSDAYRHGWYNGYTDRTGISAPEQIELIKNMRREKLGWFKPGLFACAPSPSPERGA